MCTVSLKSRDKWIQKIPSSFDLRPLFPGDKLPHQTQSRMFVTFGTCNYWDFMLFTQQKHWIFFLFVNVMSLKLRTFYMTVQSRTFKPVMNIYPNSRCICPCHALFLFWIFQCFYIFQFSSYLKVSHFECLYACVCACAGMCMYIPGKARRQVVAVSQVQFTLLF